MSSSRLPVAGDRSIRVYNTPSSRTAGRWPPVACRAGAPDHSHSPAAGDREGRIQRAQRVHCLRGTREHHAAPSRECRRTAGRVGYGVRSWSRQAPGSANGVIAVRSGSPPRTSMAPRTIPRCTWQTTCGYRLAASRRGQRRNIMVRADWSVTGSNPRSRRSSTTRRRALVAVAGVAATGVSATSSRPQTRPACTASVTGSLLVLVRCAANAVARPA